MSETLSASIRERLKRVMGVCDKCGGPGKPLRAIGKASKVTASTLCRFLNGKSITSTNLDKIAAWVVKEESL